MVMFWSRRALIWRGRSLVSAPWGRVTTLWSRGELEVVASGDASRNLLQGHCQPLGRCPAVDDECEHGVLPERGLPPAGVVEEIGLQAAAHAGGCVEGVLTVAVLDAAAKRRLGK